MKDVRVLSCSSVLRLVSCRVALRCAALLCTVLCVGAFGLRFQVHPFVRFASKQACRAFCPASARFASSARLPVSVWRGAPLNCGAVLCCAVLCCSVCAGKVLRPKVGILTMLLDLFFERRVKDLVFVPISINYDALVEAESFIRVRTSLRHAHGCSQAGIRMQAGRQAAREGGRHAARK